MRYALTEGDSVIRFNDNETTDSFGPGNCEWTEYLSWLAAGNTPAPYTPPPTPVPFSVPKAKAKIVLARAGLLAPLLAYIDSMPDDDEKKIAFLDIADWERNSPTLIWFATNVLGLDDQGIDDFFIEADAVVL